MEAVVAKHGLPIEWLTVRRNGRNPDFEGGEIVMLEGRGGWSGTQVKSADPTQIVGQYHVGDWIYHLSGHRVEQHWLSATLAEPDLLAEAAELFEELVQAIDAAYGYLGIHRGRLVIDRELPDVFWLNYFGPAFLKARPDLAQLTGSRVLASGGALVKTTDFPWQPGGDRAHADWKTELRAIFRENAFRFEKPRNQSLPSLQDHLDEAPGTTEMPWERWEREKEKKGRVNRNAAARRRLAKALEGRGEPLLGDDAVEWSTSFDADEFSKFFGHLKRRLGGELSTPIGTGLRATIVTAPIDEEDSLVVDTELGAVRIAWFIDDIEVVDLYVFGSPEVRLVCEAWFA